MKNGLASLAIILTLALWPWSDARADKPEGVAATFVAHEFYRTCAKLEPRGLPTSEQMKRFAPLFTRELTAMFHQARQQRSQQFRESSRHDHRTPRDDSPHPLAHVGTRLDGVPPTPPIAWRQGNLFTSLSDRSVSFFSIGFPVIHGDTATVPIHLEHHEQGRVTRWIDVLVLERHPNNPRHGRSAKDWFVADLFFNAPWPLDSGASLRSRLWTPLQPVGTVAVNR
jgi:hypothetical protein